VAGRFNSCRAANGGQRCHPELAAAADRGEKPYEALQISSGKRVPLAPRTRSAALEPKARDATHGSVPEAPISASLWWPPTSRPARIAQLSEQRVEEADAAWATRGPRFARFATAMEVDPPSRAQLLDGLCQSQRRRHPTAASSVRRSRRVRIPTADPVKSLTGIQWLAIGSWAFFCAALFVSLLLPSERVSLQLDQIQPRALVSDVRSIAGSTLRRLLPTHDQEVVSTSPTAAPELDARPADRGTRAGPEADRQ
jgi:hypothetical protein